jgi:hypothetical protein
VARLKEVSVKFVQWLREADEEDSDEDSESGEDS